MRILAVLTLLALTAPALASRRDWVGSAKCGSCHPAELAAWQVTPHATTRARFAAQRPESRCLGCHATGEAPAGPAIAIEVGCEACHGAGAAYAEADIMKDRPVALAMGMVETTKRAAICQPCHARQTRSRAFDPMGPVHPVKP